MTADSSRSSRRSVVIAGVVTTVLVAGVALSRCSGEDTSPPRADAAASASREERPQVPVGASGPTDQQAGLDVGFGQDEDGAVAAAVSYATAAQRWLYFTDEEIRAAIDQIATPMASARLEAEVVRDVSLARDQLGASSGRVWWLVRPLAWRVDDFRSNQARVSVWTLTILSASEVAAPQAEYLTVVLDLAWVDGDWRVDAVRDSPGPTPMTGPQDQPWDAEPFDESLAGFTRMDGEPVR